MMSFLSGCSLMMPAPDLGLQKGSQLHSCPASPNCVISQTTAEDSHYVLPLMASPVQWQRLQAALLAEQDAELLVQTDNYLHLAVRTPVLRFIDDFELFYSLAGGHIHVRSASRLGYSDFGKNRSRVEAWRAWLGAH